MYRSSMLRYITLDRLPIELLAPWFGVLLNPSMGLILSLLFTYGQQQTLSYSFSTVKSLILHHLQHQDFCKKTRMEQNNLRTH